MRFRRNDPTIPDQTENPAGTEQDFTVTRIFDASRELVWSALTDPQQLIRFWGPEGTSVPIESITVEPRQGGVFRLTMVLNEGGTEFPMTPSSRSSSSRSGWSSRPPAASRERSN